MSIIVRTDPLEGNYITVYTDIWLQIYPYLSPLDIVTLSLASRIFRQIAANNQIWHVIGKQTFCFISKNENPREIVYSTLKKAHRAGMQHFSFNHPETHFFKRHWLLLASIRKTAQRFFHSSQDNPDLLRLLLQAGARPPHDFYKCALTPNLPFETYQLCLEGGAEPTRLLLSSCINGSLEQVRYIVEKGIKPDFSILAHALRSSEKPEILDYLFEQIEELDDFCIEQALDAHYTLETIMKIASKVNVIHRWVISSLCRRNPHPALVGLLMSKVKEPFVASILEIGNGIRVGYDGDFSLPTETLTAQDFGLEGILQGNIHIRRWDVFELEAPVIIRL